ncbi:DUF4190 domain-containing protein [Streptomyces sp. NPDC006368]|uniref:DUF4190 domain-containing protein n=1 Tax=Streptomyces sp. NPDC006368 TaxID=3156760 RepID=UPI0033B592C2
MELTAHRSGTRHRAVADDGAGGDAGERPGARVRTARTPTRIRSRARDADGMAVAAFVLGLVGLLVMNVLLGPIAIGLAALALRRGTTRRGRALLGLGLGVADLVILAALVSLDHTVSWSVG